MQVPIKNYSDEPFTLKARQTLVMLQINENYLTPKLAIPLKYIKITGAPATGKIIGYGTIGISDTIYVGDTHFDVADKKDNGDGTYTYTSDDSSGDYSSLVGKIGFNFDTALLKVLGVAATDIELGGAKQIVIPVYISGSYVVDYSDFEPEVNQALMQAIKQNTQGITVVWLGN